MIECVATAADPPVFGPQTALGRGPLGAAQAADRAMAAAFVARVRAIAAFAGERPSSADRAQGEPGAMSPQRWAARPEILAPVSEWAAPELSIGLTCSRRKAEDLIGQALMLVRLPGVLAATEAGLLSIGHLWCLEEHVASLADPVLRAEVEAVLLGWGAARAGKGTITTPAPLREEGPRELARRHVGDKAQEAITALRRRGVFPQAESGEGLAALLLVGSIPEIEALRAALAAYADALPTRPDETRTREQQLLDVLVDLVLRPGESGLPPVQVVLTLVAAVQTVLGGDAPAELNGRIVSAETARQLLNALTGAGLGEGVLEELRRIAAGPESADDAEAADFEPAATDVADHADLVLAATDVADHADLVPAATVAEPDGGEDRFVDEPGWEPWEPEMVAAREQWAANFERRLAAGGYDDPDPMPDAVWRASVAARLAGERFEVELDRELAAAQDRWWREYQAGLHPDPDPDDDRPGPSPTEPPPPTEPSPGEPVPERGAWAAAERAVEDARVVQAQAERALALAGGLVRQAMWADAADEHAWRTGSGGRVAAAEDAMTALRAATGADRAALHVLLGRTAGGGLAERPRIALVDALTGALVSLTDLPGLTRATRDGLALGAPPPSDGYRPGAALDRFIRHRDRRCRFPGCRLPVSRGEMDHRIAWPEGPTDVTNLGGFCTGDHRGKHQAPGFTYDMKPDGTLLVTTPSGITVTTEPTPY